MDHDDRGRRNIRTETRDGVPTSNSPAKDWRRVCERGEITRRSSRLGVTLPPTPWDEEKHDG